MNVSCGRKALFLDRDGVINVDRGYVHLPRQTEWIPGIFELCRTASELGYLLVVITNQAGIARGYYDEAQFETYSAWMREQFRQRELSIAAIYHCPHHPDDGVGALRTDCDCRKPKPGMILRAQGELGLDLSASALIGDMPSDLEAGRAAGIPQCFAFDAFDPQHQMAAAVTWLRSLSPVEIAT